MQVFYTREELPKIQNTAIFLAGPTPREPTERTWRTDALDFLKKVGFTGEVFVPENRDPTQAWENGSFSYKEQVDWEEKALNRADVIVFWIPREMGKMPGLTTNDEFGYWKSQDPMKLVLGAPPDAQKIAYQKHWADSLNIPFRTTLEDTLLTALGKFQRPYVRIGGEAEVPIHIWRTPSFQRWLEAQRGCGNRIDGARVLWTYRVGPRKDILFAWALKVNVHVFAEDRNKVNEFVLSRTDISTIIAYRRADDGNPVNTRVVLVREFRSPVSNQDGFVWELPGGSSIKPGEEPEAVASHELHEETGLRVSPDRFRYLGSRQLAATFSAHHAHLFAVELTYDEMQQMVLDDRNNKTHGVIADSEITYTRVMSVWDIIHTKFVDYTTLGMIMEGLGR